MTDDRAYLMRRQSQSRLMAKNATSTMARIAHETFASEYAARLESINDAEANAYETESIAQPLRNKLRDS